MPTLPDAPPAGNAGPDGYAHGFTPPGPTPADGADGLLPGPQTDADEPTAAAAEPFPEPDAGLPFYRNTLHLFDVFRTAWPRLSADLRNWVAADVADQARYARNRLEFKGYGDARYTEAENRRRAAARPRMAAAWAALDALADAAHDLAEHLAGTAAGWFPDALPDLGAVAHLAGLTADNIADSLELDERERAGEGVIPRPELPAGHEGRPSGDRLAEVLALAGWCLKPVAAFSSAEADNPNSSVAEHASACRHVRHLIESLVMWDMYGDGRGWPNGDQLAEGEELVKAANACVQMEANREQPGPAVPSREAAGTAMLARVYTGLAALADASDAAAEGLADHCRGRPQIDGREWPDSLKAAGFVAGIMARELADTMALASTGTGPGAPPRPRLPAGHADGDPAARMGEVLAFAETCLGPADLFAHEPVHGGTCGDTPDRVRRTAYAVRAILSLNEGELGYGVYDLAAGRVADANPDPAG